MPESSTRVRDCPHFRVAAFDLANWIEKQGEESWWSVDGDPLLTQRLDFPCPGEDLAVELRKIAKPLLILDSKDKPTAAGETVSAVQLDEIAYRDHSGDRVFQLCWENGSTDWLLIEDTETSESGFGLDDEE